MATYPVVRRQRLSSHRRRGAGPLHRPGRLERLRAGLRVQDDDRDDGPRGGHRHAHDPHQGRRHAPARRRRGQDRQRRPQGHGLDDVRGRHRLLAQRGRRQGRARARATRRPDPRRCCTTPGASSATARGPASMSPARSAGSCATRRTSRGAEIDLANAAFGQGVAVTPIQLATRVRDDRQRRDDGQAARRPGHRGARRRRRRPATGS